MARCCSSVWFLGLSLLAACGGEPTVDLRGSGVAAGDGPAGSADADDAGAPGFGNSAFDARDVAPDPDAAVPMPVCAEVEAHAERRVPFVTLVVDGSGSMRCAYPEPADCGCDAQLRDQCEAPAATSRWQALSRALFGDGAAEEGIVARLEHVVRFGMLVYHDPPNAPSCPTLPVELAPGLAQAAALAQGFPAEPPGANTPTALALAHAFEALPAATDDAPQHVVLATDGSPFECFDSVTLEPPALDYASVEALAAAAAADGVSLHVLSLAPASGDFATHLDAVAGLGGTGAALLPADADALVAQLEQVVTSAISCEVTLDGTVAEGLECDGTITLGDDALECEGADGYRLLDPARLELLGNACERFRRDPGATLQVTFPCDVFTPN